MSYLPYITIYYQHAINDHANATKATKYIPPYRYKKSSLKPETTETESIRFLENNLFFGQ